MQQSKKPPKPHVLANYYENMALVFWKAGNHQFHAATLHRLYVLYKEQKKSISQEETQKYVLFYSEDVLKLSNDW